MTAVSSRSLTRAIFIATAVAIALLAFTATRSSAAYTITDFKLTPSPLPTPAGGHPKMHYHVDPDASTAGSDDLKKIVLDFPAGLLGNPEAASPKCVATGTGTANKFASDNCPSTSYIGSMLIKWKEPLGNLTSAPGSVYVLSPATAGSAATIGFIVRPQGWRKVFLKTEVGGIVTVRTGTEADYGLTLTVDNIPRVLTSSRGLTYPITISDIAVDINSRAGGTNVNSPNGAYFTFNPTRCDAATTRAKINSYGSSTTITKSSSYTPSDCASVKFEPTASVTPSVTTPGAATGVNATFGIPTADAPVQQSHVKSIQVDLPPGTGLNFPAIGAVPALCTEAKLNADTCPAGAKIGTVSAAVPFLPPTMTGDVYLLTRNSSITFGYILRGANGVKAPLKGSAAAVDIDGDGGADLVRATASTMPQVPWTTASINFTSKLINNPTNACGPNSVTSKLNGWSGATATRSNSWFGVVNCTPPAVAITSPANGSVTASNSTNVAFTVDGSATIPVGTSCTINGLGTSSTQTNSVALALGANTIVVSCTNGAGTGSAVVTVTWTSPPPPITITAPANNSNTTAATTSVAWTISGGVPPITCTLNGAAATSPATVNLAMGANTITVVCSNAGGTASASVTVNRGVAPVVTITSPTTGSPVTGTTVQVAWTTTGTAPITCTVNGAAATSPTTVSLASGSNTITVACTNEFGSDTKTVVPIIGRPPVVTITAPANNSNTTAATSSITWTTTGIAPISCTVNGSAVTSPATVNLVMGANTITVTCSNAFGSDTKSVVVNRGVAPVVTITSPTTGSPAPSGGTVSVAWTVTGTAPITCTVNGAVATSPATVNIPNGSFTITVSCTNAFGSDTKSLSITSPPAPVVTITSPANNSSTSNATTPVTWVATGTAPVTCTVNGSAATSPATVNLVMGANTILVTCTNAYGSDTKSVVVNRGNPPVAVITSPANNSPATGSSVNVIYTVNGSSVLQPGTTCTLNGTPTTTPPGNTIMLSPGANTITLICVNQYGASAPSTITILPPVSPPTVQITSPTSYPQTNPFNVSYTVNGVASIPAGVTCTVNGSVSSSATTNSVARTLGTVTVTVACTNVNGTGSAVASFQQEPIALVAITSPANNSWTSSASTNVMYTVAGSSTIPANTTCVVNGTASTSTTINSVALAVSPNTITVVCTNVFGSDTKSITVNRDNTPPSIGPISISPPNASGYVTITYSATDNSGFTPTCAPPSGSQIYAGGGSVAVTVTCTDIAGNAAAVSIVITGTGGGGSLAVTITGGPTGATPDDTPTFTWAANQPESGPYPCAPGQTCIQIIVPYISYACTMDGSSVPCSGNSYTSPSLPLGSHTFCVTAHGIYSGQNSASACRTFTVVSNAGPPVVQITSPATNPTNTGATSINVAYTVDGSTTIPAGTNCTVNGVASTTPLTNTVALASGANTITVTCTNAGGSGTMSVVVNRGLGLFVTITSPATGSNTTAATANVTYTVIGSGVITCTVNGNTSTSPYTVNLQLGANAITVSCTNGTETDTRTIVVNRGIAPLVTITAPTNAGSTTAGTVAVAWTTTGTAPVTCTLNGSAAISPSTVNLSVGGNSITVVCINAFGSDTKSVTFTRTAASFAPTFNQTLSSTMAGTGTDMHWSVTHPAGAEGIRRIRVLQDPSVAPNFASFGSSADTCSTTGTTSTSFNVAACPTQARFGAVSINAAGYAAPITGYAYFIGYSVIPRIGIDVNPSIPGNPSGLSFQMVINNTVTLLDPTCDDEDPSLPLGFCPRQLAMLIQDVPNIGITGITADLGGMARTSSTGAALDPHPFVLDTLPCGGPATSLATTAQFTGWSATSATVADSDPLSCPPVRPSIHVTSPSPTVRWTQSASVTLTYTVDPGDGDTPVCTIPSGTTVALTNGPNTISFSCTNSAGTGSANVQIGRDNQSPVITITSPAAGAHLNLLSITNPASYLHYTVTDDWDTQPQCTPPPGVLSGLNQGANVINVTCVDHAGNTAIASRMVFFDNIVPTVTADCVETNGPATSCTFSASELATFTCQVNNGPATSCTSPHNATGLLTDYLNSITVCATDQAGNTACVIETVGTPLPGVATITDYAKPTSTPGGPGGPMAVSFTPATAECRVDGGTFTTCSSPWTVPTSGLSSPAEHTYDVRAVGQATTPARGYMWIDSRSYSAAATVTPQANSLTTAAAATSAGAHPDISATVAVAGADDPKDVSVQFPDGLMGSLRSVPVGSRCAVADATAGTCPASSEIGMISGTMVFANGGTTTATGTVHLVDSAGLPSQYVAGTAISLKNIPGGHGDLNVTGNLALVDATARAMRLEATDLPRQTSNNDKFHLLSGTVTIKGDTGGAANPLITNPHFCGPFNSNRKSPGGVTANNFWGTATSYEGNTTPEVTASYNVVNCSAIPFNPSITSSFSSLEAGTSTALTTNVTMPTGNSPMRTAIMKLPSFIAPSFPSFGTQSDQCSSGSYFPAAGTGSYILSASAFGTATSAYREFTTANCPAQARAGTATITSPLVPGNITADVYLSASSPIPNIGIYVDPTKYGNPQGIKIGIIGTSATPQLDLLCDPATSETGDCPTQIQATFSSLPDVPLSSMSLTLGGMTGRALGANMLVIASASDPACSSAGQNLSTTFAPWSSTTNQSRTQLITPTGCNQ